MLSVSKQKLPFKYNELHYNAIRIGYRSVNALIALDRPPFVPAVGSISHFVISIVISSLLRSCLLRCSVFPDHKAVIGICQRATLFILSRANLAILADADKDKSPSALPNSLFFFINPAKTRYIGIKKDPAHHFWRQGLIWFSLNSLSRQANFFCPQEDIVFWF